MAYQRTTDWRQDGSGNRWRVWKDAMVILFCAVDGRWRWSVADRHHTRISNENFATEGEARAALGEELEAGPAWDVEPRPR